MSWRILSDEERMGMPSIPDDYDPTSTKHRAINKKGSSTMLYKFVGAIGLFVVCIFLLQTNNEFFHKEKQWLNAALTDDFPFAQMYDLYAQYLGIPLALVPSDFTHIEDHQSLESTVLPVSGEVIESFHQTGTGIKITPMKQSAVRSMKGGIVIFAGNRKETNKTIIVQHADQSVTTYGNLATIDVHLYSYVKPHQQIGSVNKTAEENPFFFSIEKENKYVDPLKVIPVHDAD